MASDSSETSAHDASTAPRSDPGAFGDLGSLARIADALEAIQGLLERRLAVDEATAAFTDLLRTGMGQQPPGEPQATQEPWLPFEDYREGMVGGTYEVLRGDEWAPASARDQHEIAAIQRGRRGRR